MCFVASTPSISGIYKCEKKEEKKGKKHLEVRKKHRVIWSFTPDTLPLYVMVCSSKIGRQSLAVDVNMHMLMSLHTCAFEYVYV